MKDEYEIPVNFVLIKKKYVNIFLNKNRMNMKLQLRTLPKEKEKIYRKI